MKRPFRSLIVTVSLAFGVWTFAVVDLSQVATSFKGGDVLSATTFNELFAAIDANFQAVVAAIEGNETAVEALEGFDAALASSSCPPGQALQAVAPDGTATCAATGGADPDVVPAVSATLGASLVVASGSLVTVPYEAEFFDTAELHDPIGDAPLLIASEAGIYQVSATVTWPNDPDGIRQILVRPPGGFGRLSDTRQAVSGVLSQSLSGLLRLDAGDALEVVAFQTSGADLTLSATSPQQFAMVKVATAP